MIHCLRAATASLWTLRRSLQMYPSMHRTNIRTKAPARKRKRLLSLASFLRNTLVCEWICSKNLECEPGKPRFCPLVIAQTSPETRFPAIGRSLEAQGKLNYSTLGCGTRTEQIPELSNFIYFYRLYFAQALTSIFGHLPVYLAKDSGTPLKSSATAILLKWCHSAAISNG
jgi:hypothetical protein